MFTGGFRRKLRQFILDMAAEDHRVASAALIGSFAVGKEDRWSDIDLAFGIHEEYAVSGILRDWTANLEEKFSALVLFDLAHAGFVYRVFLFENCLQVDLSFAPASNFGAVGPHFKQFFGEAVSRAQTPPPAADQLIGHCIHHLLRTRVSIERGRYWQAAYWLNMARDQVMALLCLKWGLNPAQGRGFDDLPSEWLAILKETVIRFAERDELNQGMVRLIDFLRNPPDPIREICARFSTSLKQIAG